MRDQVIWNAVCGYGNISLKKNSEVHSLYARNPSLSVCIDSMERKTQWDVFTCHLEGGG